MRDIIKNRDSRRKQWLWFVVLYTASLLAFTAAVYLLHWLIL